MNCKILKANKFEMKSGIPKFKPSITSSHDFETKYKVN